MSDIPWARALTTAALWSSWCVVHSLLNSEGPLGRTRVLRTSFRSYYRLLYNLIAVGSLVFVWSVTPREGEMALWAWNGWLGVVQVCLWGLAAFMFYESFRLLDFVSFLEFSTRPSHSSPTSEGAGLVTTGIYGIVRHPQFAAGLIVLWSRDLTDTGLVVNVVLSLYLVIGAHIEESRLLGRYGESYARYMKDVPGFIPRPRFRRLSRKQ